MRFHEDGPAIPDELLIARDEGRVVFFCGAGVSRARAGLFDFFGLADDVIRRLGVPADSPVNKILEEARLIDKRTGVNGLISADRIFGLLEREFDTPTIEAAVASALRPPAGADLSAHRVLLELATTPEGRTRLVTTNFDRLFHDCNNRLVIWQPPRLPNLSRPDEMNGIVHLHGCATQDYDGSEEDGFVLSSSDFGRAYLADGWATKFFSEIIDKYVVAFVGYTADDPPVQYLLEALNKKAGQLSGVYAFQAGDSDEAAARWRHKGIEAIAYAEANKHEALWRTLEAWAERARDPEAWYGSIIDLAQKGPEHLQPHERGQVAHIVSTVGGARKFADTTPSPPAEWLCVFDPHRRYAKPGRCGGCGDHGEPVDPFDLYGLDSDPVPAKIAPDDPYANREVPKTAWDGFAANRLDRRNLRDESVATARGRFADNMPRLSSRLETLGAWIRQVADQPASLWWATHQDALHPEIRRQIKWSLERQRHETPSVIRRAWRYLFEAWEKRRDDCHRDWHELKAVIKKDSWDHAAIRRYAAVSQPYLKATKSYLSGPTPPKRQEDLRLHDLLHLNVEYPDPPTDLEIPDEWLSAAVGALRRNLEHALYLENELGGHGLTNISPLIPDNAPGTDCFDRTHGLSGNVVSFSSLFARLAKLDIAAARDEIAAWPTNDDTLFCHLRIWASGFSELFSTKAFGSFIAQLSNEAFWNYYHQRDLLLSLAKRWKKLSRSSRVTIEHRLLEGPPRWDSEEDAQFDERRAWDSLNRIIWLADNDCSFTFDLAAERENLKAKAPNWKNEYAAEAAASREGRGGWVKTETAHESLLKEPLSSVLSKALELSGRSDNHLTQNDPFAGLAAEHPVRALAALTNAAKQNVYPVWAWCTFLNSEARKTDEPRLSALIAQRMIQAPNEVVAEFVRPASDWLSNVSKNLASNFPETFDNTLSKFMNVLHAQPANGNSAIVSRGNERNWVGEAINAPAGKIARALMADPRKDGVQPNSGFNAAWLSRVNELLSLPNDLRCHAMAIFAYNLGWFHVTDPKWAEANLLSALDGHNECARDAVLSGFLWGAKAPNPKLYMHLKPCLLGGATDRHLSRHGYDEVLAGMILLGWESKNDNTGERCISNDEMRRVLLRTDDKFRTTILWQAERWSQERMENSDKQWSELLVELLRDVWPRQKSAKTPIVSSRLCDIVFSDLERFPQMAEIILPLLTPLNGCGHWTMPGIKRSIDNILDSFPQKSLDIICAIIPDDVREWPYDMDAIFDRLVSADGNLRFNARLIELRRRWNAR